MNDEHKNLEEITIQILAPGTSSKATKWIEQNSSILVTVCVMSLVLGFVALVFFQQRQIAQQNQINKTSWEFFTYDYNKVSDKDLDMSDALKNQPELIAEYGAKLSQKLIYQGNTHEYTSFLNKLNFKPQNEVDKQFLLFINLQQALIHEKYAHAETIALALLEKNFDDPSQAQAMHFLQAVTTLQMISMYQIDEQKQQVWKNIWNQQCKTPSFQKIALDLHDQLTLGRADFFKYLNILH